MKLKYYFNKGSYKEVIRDDKDMLQCPFCGEWFRGLAYHTIQKHGVTGMQLRKMLGVKSSYQLTTNDIKERHREIVMENKDSHIKTNLIKKGNKTRYKKGFEGHIKKNWSNQAIQEMKQRFGDKK
jgi:hypothetical protein